MKVDEGEYFVEITVDGCSNTDTINVIYSSLPQAIISGDYEVCAGNQVSIDIIVTGSSPFEITYTNGTDTNVVYGNDSIIIDCTTDIDETCEPPFLPSLEEGRLPSEFTPIPPTTPVPPPPPPSKSD